MSVPHRKREKNALYHIFSLSKINLHLAIYGDAVMLFVSVGESRWDCLKPIFQHWCGMQAGRLGRVLPGFGRLHDQRFRKESRLLRPPFVSLPNPHYQMYNVVRLQHNDTQFTSRTFSCKHTRSHAHTHTHKHDRLSSFQKWPYKCWCSLPIYTRVTTLFIHVVN